jgi:hypothetical protein
MYSTEIVANATELEKAEFYKKTYTHLAAAVLLFIGVEYLLIKVVPEDLIIGMVSTKSIWLALIGVFWLLSMLTDKLAFAADRTTQYLGLGLYVVLEAVIFLPMIYMAYFIVGGNILNQAAIITLAMFGGLTALVFSTNKDFSFLRNILVIGGFVSLGLIIAGALFGFDLGLWFSVAMVALASGSIIYQTNNLKYHYQTDQYVGAALQLFAAVMLLFWYILRILMRFSRRN